MVKFNADGTKLSLVWISAFKERSFDLVIRKVLLPWAKNSLSMGFRMGFRYRDNSALFSSFSRFYLPPMNTWCKVPGRTGMQQEWIVFKGVTSTHDLTLWLVDHHSWHKPVTCLGYMGEQFVETPRRRQLMNPSYLRCCSLIHRKTYRRSAGRIMEAPWTSCHARNPFGRACSEYVYWSLRRSP